MNKKTLLVAIATAIFIGLGSLAQVSAAQYVFTSPKCNPEHDSKTDCIAKGKPTKVKEFTGNVERFIERNKKVLPKDVGPDTVLPANTFYIFG